MVCFLYVGMEGYLCENWIYCILLCYVWVGDVLVDLVIGICFVVVEFFLEYRGLNRSLYTILFVIDEVVIFSCGLIGSFRDGLG